MKKVKNDESNQESALTGRVRRDLAVLAALLLIIISTVAAIQNGAMPVLDKLLPLLIVVFAFFFEPKPRNR